MAPNPTDMMLLGGRSRLAQALFAACVEQRIPVQVLYRSPEERASLLARYPASALFDAWSVPEGAAGSRCLVVCSHGLAHPARPDIATQFGGFERETSELRRVIDLVGPAPHVVLVSTAVALAPPRDRAYYAAFKNLSEAATAFLLCSVPAARLSVVYPGQLAERRRWTGLRALLATPYAALAQRLIRVARKGGPASCVVGLDARLWLLSRAAGLAQAALFSHLPTGPLQLRDGLPRAP